MLPTWFSLLQVIVAVAISQSNIVHVSVYSSLHIHSCLWGSMFVLCVSYSVYVQPSYMCVQLPWLQCLQVDKQGHQVLGR